MIVEFFGLPGSGKTYTARELENSHGFIRIKLKRRSKIVFLFVVFVLANPVFSLRHFFLYWRKVVGIYNWWNFIILRYAKMQQAIFFSKNGRQVILDEGPIQNSISFPELFSAKELESLVNKNKSDAYVIFDIGEEIRKARFNIRGYGQRDQYNEEKKIEWAKKASEVNTLFTESFKGNNNFLIITENIHAVKAVIDFVKKYED